MHKVVPTDTDEKKAARLMISRRRQQRQVSCVYPEYDVSYALRVPTSDNSQVVPTDANEKKVMTTVAYGAKEPRTKTIPT